MRDNLFLKVVLKGKASNYIVFLFLYCCLSFFSCNNDQQKSNKRNFITRDFLKFYCNEMLRKKSVILLDIPSDYNLKSCLLSVTLSSEYKLFNDEDFSNKFDLTLWDKKDINGLKLISKRSLPDIRTPEGWQNFKKNIGEGYYIFSHPIVSKDSRYILFYTAYYCGERCGYDTLALYEKTKTGWKLVKKYCDGIS